MSLSNLRDLLPSPPVRQGQGNQEMPMHRSLPGGCKSGCEICGGVGWVRRDLPIDDPEFGRMQRCPNASLLDITRPELFGLKDGDMNLTWDSIRGSGPLVKQIERIQQMFMAKSGMILLYGQPGTAKTLMLRIAVAVAAGSGWRARYANLPDILDHIRASYSQQAAMDVLIERMDGWATLDVLSVDEADKASMTDWTRERVFSLLDRRYRAALEGRGITFMAANDISRLDQYLLSRFSDSRIGLVVDLTQAKDQRPTARSTWPR